MNKQIGTSAGQRDYWVSLARRSPVISTTCLKIGHHWSKSEADWTNSAARRLRRCKMFHRQFEKLEGRINASGSMTSLRPISVLYDVFLELGTDADNSRKPR